MGRGTWPVARSQHAGAGVTRAAGHVARWPPADGGVTRGAGHVPYATLHAGGGAGQGVWYEVRGLQCYSKARRRGCEGRCLRTGGHGGARVLKAHGTVLLRCSYITRLCWNGRMGRGMHNSHGACSMQVGCADSLGWEGR